MLDTTYIGNPIKRWFVAVALLLGAFLLGRMVSALLRIFGARFKSQLLSAMATESRGPVTALVSVLGGRVAAEALVLPAGVKVLVEKGLAFLSVITLTWLVANTYDAVHKGVFEPYARKSSAMNSIGFEVSAILAGVGIGGMALALASQDTVANLFGGVLLLAQRPFKVGERIEVAGINGWVHQLGLRNTTIKNWYGRLVIIPNKKFIDSVLINIDSQSVYYQELRLRLVAETTPEQVEKALQILRDIVADGPLLDKTPWVAFDRIEHGFFEIEFWYAILKWTAKDAPSIPNEYEKLCQGKTWVNLEILRRFEAARLRFAVPLQAYVAGGVERRAALPPALEQARPREDVL